MFTPLKQELRQTGSTRFYVKVRPGASTTEALEQMEDGSIKLNIAAPPVGGKANEALIKFLAQEFEVPRGNVQLVSGRSARTKLIKVVK